MFTCCPSVNMIVCSVPSTCLGVIGSLFSLLQFISSPVMGALSDVYGRRPMMIFSMVSIWS